MRLGSGRTELVRSRPVDERRSLSGEESLVVDESPMKTEPIHAPETPRLVREARRWSRHGRTPESIVEPGPGQRSVWRFPRPPAAERVLERVTVEFGGALVADTRGAIRICETASPPTYYLPDADVHRERLRPGAGSSMCEWKGSAVYYDVCVGERVAAQAAWSYPSPFPEYGFLEGHIAFYASRVDRCTVAGDAVTPQAGAFYAGWITPELAGPFKGGPGSEGW